MHGIMTEAFNGIKSTLKGLSHGGYIGSELKGAASEFRKSIAAGGNFTGAGMKLLDRSAQGMDVGLSKISDSLGKSWKASSNWGRAGMAGAGLGMFATGAGIGSAAASILSPWGVKTRNGTGQ